MGADTQRAPRERPLLMSGPLVRAVLEGRKTQTRRLVQPRPTLGQQVLGMTCAPDEWWLRRGTRAVRLTGPGRAPLAAVAELCPLGQPGDVLWVRETWRKGATEASPWAVDYRADGGRRMWAEEPDDSPDWYWLDDAPWRPSIHMPKWASRLSLVIEDVRVERLQDISEEDARAEGCRRTPGALSLSIGAGGERHHLTARDAFASLWDSLAPAGSRWADSPWVWCIRFAVEGRA